MGVHTEPSHPFTSLQRQIWLDQRLSANASACNIGGHLDILGPVDPTLFQRATNLLLQKHTLLHVILTKTRDEDGLPLQACAKPFSVTVPLHDLSQEARPEVTALAWMKARLAQPFELHGQPLFRYDLLKIGKAHYSCLMQYHHLIVDGPTATMLNCSLAAIYSQLSAGLAPDLQSPSDLSDGKADRSCGPAAEFQQKHDSWLMPYPQSPGPLLRPMDRGTHGDGLVGGDRETMVLSRALTQRLERLAEAHGVTLRHVLLAGLYLSFIRAVQRDDCPAGQPPSNHDETRISKTTTLFCINHSPVRFTVGRVLSFGLLLEQIDATLRSIGRHQHVPANEILRATDAVATRSRFFDVGLSSESPPTVALFGGIEGRFTPLSHPGESPPLRLLVREVHSGADVPIDFSYNHAYSAQDIRTLQDSFRFVLETAVMDPSQPIVFDTALASTHHQQVIKGWNATEAHPLKDRSVHQWVEARALGTPMAIAVVCEEQTLTYADLNARANRLAHHLIEQGIRPDDRVAIAVERSLEMVVGLLAILKAGGAYVPLDPAYPEERLAFMVEDSTPVALLVHGATRERVAGLAGVVPIMDLEADAEAWAERSASNPDPSALGLKPNHLAYVIYTSGSTGKPKGVLVEHRQVSRLFSATEDLFRFGPEDVWSLFHSYAFDFSVWELWGALCHGGRLVIVPWAVSRSPSEFYQLLCREGVTVVNQTPSAFQTLSYAQAESPERHRLRYVIFGGEKLEMASLKPWFRHNPEPGTRLVNMYGITETTVHVTYRQLEAADADLMASPIGVPLPDLRVYLLDRDGQAVPLGQVGEMYVGGAGVARGYLNRPELTAERFLPDPFTADPEARMYRTGDLARWQGDGSLESLGRADFQVKIRGFRIELGEIEAALRGCEGIREAVVLAREDAPGEKRLVAYVTTDRSADTVDTRAAGPIAEAVVLPAALKDQLQRSLPDYMVPAAFVVLDSFPLTPNGKLDRKALPAPEAEAFAVHAYEPPAGPVEEALAELWSELLGIERVGRHDDFFALGGHSLLAVQVISRLRSSLGVEVSLAELFARPVLAELAAGLADAKAAEGGAIPPADRSQPLPLSFAQRRLWFLAQLEGPSATYNIPLGWRLLGELDPEALRAALDQLVVRHEVLRTTFVGVDGEPAQRIAPATEGHFALIEQDLRETPDGEAELAHWLEIEAAEAFDLEKGPMARGRLLRLAEREHALLLTLHHAIADGWSLGVMGREQGALYGAIRRGKADPLAPLPIQYADYAVWERQWVAEERLQRQAAYWKSALADAPVLLELPTDRPRPPVQDYVGAMVPVVLDAELTGKLKALARRHGASLFQVLLAGFAALLSRLSGQGEVVIGSPSAHRNRTEVEGLIGFFVNTLALRIDTASANVGELIARAKEQTLAAQAHEDLPFEQVVELLQPPRSLAHAPLFQVMFAWQNTPEAELALSDLSCEALVAPHGVAKFDLTLALAETGEGIEGGLEYATALFERATVERWVGHWRTLLTGLVKASETTAVGRLPLLSEAERQQVLEEWNATEAEYFKDQCIHQLFEAQAERTPEAVAVVFREQSLRYTELNSRANRLAHHLIDLGIRPDDRVAIGVERSLEMVVGLLAILKAGGAYVPLDPDYPEERLAFMLKDSAPVALLVHGATRERFAALAGGVPMVDLEADAGVWAGRSASNPNPSALGLGPNHLAYVIYTSGSTGRPKGVMVEHRGVCNLAAAQIREFGLAADSRVLQFASFSFDACVFEVVMALANGASLCLPGTSVALVGDALAAAVAEAEATHLTVPPAALASLEATEGALGSVQTLILAGERLPEGLARRWATGRRLFNAYGPTETTVWATVQRCSADATGDPPIGRPIANTRLYLLGDEGEPVPIGVPGEVHIGGAGVARGYLNRPELTAERFLPDPFATEPDARMYRTGDRALWQPDGVLQFLGRIDDQVKLRGFRIELGEIEERLAAHNAVREAVVVVWPGEGNPRLVAYVTANDGADAATLPTLLRDQLRTCLPDYMVPASIQRLESLPLTPNGKVDRKALPAPEITRSENGEPPATATEEVLAGLWATLLEQEAIRRDDDFFVLGGHSLLATQLVARIRTRFQKELTVRTVFERRRLAELAEAIDQAASGILPPPITPQPAGTPRSLSFAQQRLWFLAQWEEEASATYNMPLGLRLEGTLDITALRSSLLWVLGRHETLRTCFPLLNGEASVAVRPVDCDGELKVRDWRGLPAGDQQREVEHIANAYAVEPFRLSHGPLFKAELLVLADDRHVLLLNMHHIVGDGWSWGIFMRDLRQAYGAFAAGQPPAAPPLRLRYSDHAAWQRQWLQDGALETQAAYWANQLSRCPTLLELPTDRPRPARQSFRGARHHQVLPTALATQLQRLSRTHGATLFMTLLATFNVLLWRHSGQDDLCIGSPIAGRTHHQTEDLVGMFVNTLVLRTRLDPEQTFSALLNQTRDTCLAAYAHQDLPFEALVERLQPQRSLSHSPLFQVMFALQNNPATDLSLPGLAVTPLPLDCPVAKFDLTLDMEERDGLWHGAWEFAADLFDQATIERLAGHYQELLEAVALDPEQRIGDLPLLSDRERQQLRDWNQSATVAPRESTLIGLFERQVEQTPDNIAVEFEGQTLTYAELNARANRVAHHLLALEAADRTRLIRPDTPVAITVERSLEMMVGLLGILKAGAAYVPIDPNSPEERRRHQLEDSDAPVLLTQVKLQGSLHRLENCRVIGLETIALADQPATNPPPQSRPDSLAYVIYTSGSTGKPKGVMVEHLGVAAHCADYRERHALSAADRVLPMAAFYFDASVEQLFPVLLAGGQLLLTEFDLEPVSFATQIKAQGVTLLDVAGVYWRALVQTWIAQPELAEGSPLRTLIVGGDVMPVDVLPLWRQTPLSRTVRLFNVYGPTETTVAATIFEVPPDFDASRPRIPIGKPLANRRVHVLDQRRQPVPVGVPGELYIGGSGLARGYLNQPELTTETFVWWGERLYRTGDRACWLPDGNLDFLGRLDHQVKLRGYRVELGEIEARLKQLDHVEDAAAIVHEEGGRQVLVAYLAIPHASARAADLNREAIQEALRNSLPGYMVPARFIVVEAIPRLAASGKVDKAGLPSPTLSQPEETLAPRTPMEEAIAAIWCGVLERTAVGVQDNFFELGGHSLLATQVMSRINQAFSVKLPLQRIFDHSTIEDLAKAIEHFTLARDMVSQRSITAPAEAAMQSTNNVEEGEL